MLTGSIILTGFFGNLFFEKTKITDVVVLLAIGIILGPVSGLVSLASMHHLAEYVGRSPF